MTNLTLKFKALLPNPLAPAYSLAMKTVRKKTKPKFASKQEGHKNLVLYGKHAVEAALNNKSREKICLYATDKSLNALSGTINKHKGLRIEKSAPEAIEKLVGYGVPHQGIALQVRPLPAQHIDSFAPLSGQKNILVILDQVTDPQNVGAIIRSSIAFGARALITTDRNSPPESGALAKAASGGLETLPWVRVANLTRALEEIAELGYWRVGLSGEAENTLANTDAGDNVALVLGSEGSGIRQGVEKSCDFLAKLPINDAVESLNVSVATSISLYEMVRGSKK